MNVVFDVGNVLVRWSPVEIMRRALTESDDAQVWAKRFFGHPLWRDLNRGLFSEREAQRHYVRELSMDPDLVEAVFHHVKATQELVAGTTALLPRLQAAGYPMYALTDNVHEIVAHLRNRYDFWQYFRGVVVSAEIGLLKPEPAIFRHLLETHALRAESTVFIDDMPANVIGAREQGMHAIQFESADQVAHDLAALGLRF